jgi:hypothetical protein
MSHKFLDTHLSVCPTYFESLRDHFSYSELMDLNVSYIVRHYHLTQPDSLTPQEIVCRRLSAARMSTMARVCSGVPLRRPLLSRSNFNNAVIHGLLEIHSWEK